MKELAAIAKVGVEPKYARSMLSQLPFNEEGLPYSILPALKAHDVKPKELRDFGATVGYEKYKTEDGFDAVALINDFKAFYNRVPEEVQEQ